MSHRNKERSYEHETEIVEFWEDRGFDCDRAYASSGETLVDSSGEQLTEDVDNIVYRAIGNQDLLIQAKRRKSLGSYLIPSGMQDGVFLSTSGEEPDVYVIPDYVFAELLEGHPRMFLHLNIDEGRSSVANYVYPPDGADVTALRREDDLTSYYVVPQQLMHRLKKRAEADSGGFSTRDQSLSHEEIDERIAQKMQEFANYLNSQ